MIMYRVLHVLACSSYIGHTWQVQAPMEQLYRLTAVETGFGLQPGKPPRATIDRLRSFASLLLALAPGAAFSAGAPDLFPVLGRLAGAPGWAGRMKYASGENLAPAPFTLNGTMCCELKDNTCVLTSSVVLPNGQERTVVMCGEAPNQPGCASFRLTGEGPIDIIISEHAPDMILLQEIERESERVIICSSIAILPGGDQLLQTAHELAPGGNVTGVQMWQMHRLP
mmetsp:Transcript_83864/g.144941  ORF Transcript_83864/g.144941 Transcript_83864/m.144941 type:complete len:226 (+) Transcript_83864:59-736(+)